MKTWKGLFPQICSFANLLDASRKAQRGKRFNREVYEFNARLEDNLCRIQDELADRRWEPGPYREFYVQEAKRRLICAAPYRDRVVHHALCNVIEPLFDRAFIHDSYACRKGKGTHAAADRYTEFSRKARYVLKCDVAKYFPSVRHDVLFGELVRRIADDDTLWFPSFSSCTWERTCRKSCALRPAARVCKSPLSSGEAREVQLRGQLRSQVKLGNE